jgi:putative two-component system response regulator
MSLVSSVEIRDRETEDHCTCVTQPAISIGKELGLSQAELKVLKRGALLHDVEIIGISDSILHKPGSLSAEEWKAMHQHARISAQIIQNIPFCKMLLNWWSIIRNAGMGLAIQMESKVEQSPSPARNFAVA